MFLFRICDFYLVFGGFELLSGVQLILEKGEWVCFVGCNGIGKLMLLKIVSGEIKFDEGQIEIVLIIKIVWLEQEVLWDVQGSIYDVVVFGLGKVGELIKCYYDLIEVMVSGDEDVFI